MLKNALLAAILLLPGTADARVWYIAYQGRQCTLASASPRDTILAYQNRGKILNLTNIKIQGRSQIVSLSNDADGLELLFFSSISDCQDTVEAGLAATRN